MYSEQDVKNKASFNKVPSADPEIKQAIQELLDDPGEYFARRKPIRQAEAHAEVQEAIHRHLENERQQRIKRRRDRIARWLGRFAA